MQELPAKATGTSQLAKAFNQLRQCVIERTLLRDENFHANYQSNGFYITPRFGRGKAGKSAKQFVLKGVREEYLLCLPYSSGASIPADVALDHPSLIKIAKPEELRVSPFELVTVDGWVYETVVTSPFQGIRRHAVRVSDDKKEIQQVVPHFVHNWLIYADQPEGGTNAYDEDDLDIPWLDTNRAGRIFCKTNVRTADDGDF
jgi:hypothetical protein